MLHISPHHAHEGKYVSVRITHPAWRAMLVVACCAAAMHAGCVLLPGARPGVGAAVIEGGLGGQGVKCRWVPTLDSHPGLCCYDSAINASTHKMKVVMVSPG